MSMASYGKVKVFLMFAAAIWLLGVSKPGAVTAEDSNKWNVSLQPYLWLPTIEADLKYSTPSGSTGAPEIKIEPDDYLEDIDFAFLITAEVRRGKWSFTSDFVFMQVSSSDNNVKNVDFGGSLVSSTLDIGTDVETKSFITTFGPGYQIIDQPHLKMDLVAGLRYMWIESQLDWRVSDQVTGPNAGQTFARSGSHTEDGDIWNGIGGVRGRILLGDGNWFIPFYGDIGAGDSELTWQVFSALGYSFNDWFHMMLGYRHIEFDADDDNIIQEMRLSGPILGARFSF